jgi:hypothetical protein
MSMSREYRIKVADIIDNPDGSAKVIFDIEDGFEEEIIKMHGWEKWEQEKFEQLFISALRNYLDVHSSKNLTDSKG